MTTTSFVLPVYNAAATLRETLDSILAQSDPEFELIVVDDGSTDASHAIIVNYAARDSRIRVIAQPNGGITRALIAGCAAAVGRYIARHDAGDLSDPRRLAVQRAMLDARDDLHFVSCWTAVVGPDLEPLFVTRGTGVAAAPANVIDLDHRYCVSDGPTHHGSVVFRRDAYQAAGGYRPEFYYGQDWDLWYRLAERGKFQMAQEILYTARTTAESISASSKQGQEKIAVFAHQAVRARARAESDAPFVARAAEVRPSKRSPSDRARGLYFIGEALRRNGDRRAVRYLREAARAAPLSPRAWVRLVQAIVTTRRL